MFRLCRLYPLSSFILEKTSIFSAASKSANKLKKISMSTTPKKPDPDTGSQGGALSSKGPQSNDNENRRYEVVERGQLHTLNYRCYFRDVQTKTIVSPFHDIPLVNEQYSSVNGNQKETIYNMVVEVPRWTTAKMEINKQLKLNPLVQDVKNG
jgi:hypothetical protein